MAGPNLFLSRPPAEAIGAFLAREGAKPLSYPEVGATRGEGPVGYAVDRCRICLGKGQRTFDAACAALRRWEMFRLGWVTPWPEPPIEVGSVVGILASFGGLWFLNACRIVYLIGEEGSPRRFGFAYGTLPAHCESGEERFLIEWGDDGSVWYEIYCFSRPSAPIYRLGLPLLRWMQRRFRTDSCAAMERAVASAESTAQRTAPRASAGDT